LVALLLVVSAAAQQAPPSADTYVSNSTPSSNFGYSSINVVGNGQTSYIKFDLSTLPAGSTVNKASLRLFIDAVATGGQFDVYNLPKTPLWTESTLKYSGTRPLPGSSATWGTPHHGIERKRKYLCADRHYTDGAAMGGRLDNQQRNRVGVDRHQGAFWLRQ
jgi:hypothetical protein